MRVSPVLPRPHPCRSRIPSVGALVAVPLVAGQKGQAFIGRMLKEEAPGQLWGPQVYGNQHPILLRGS